MQMQTAVGELLQNVGEEIKELKEQIEDAVESGNTADAEEWIGILNTFIRELDHVVETLATTENK